MLKNVISQLKTTKEVESTIRTLSDDEKKEVSGGWNHRDHSRNGSGPNGSGPGRNRP